MKSIFLFILFYSTALLGEVIENPILPFDYQQNPPSVEWKHIETEHFDVIFPDFVEKTGQRVAHLLEKAYPYVTRSLEVQPEKISVILQAHTVDSNGFVTLAPRRSEWYISPAINPMLTNTEWLKTLSIHEFRHVVQFKKTRRGFNRGLEVILGEIGQALGIGLTLPPWFLEGDAVGIETALTHGGRGRLPLFDRDLRTLLLSGKDWNYDKTHLGSYDDYVPNHYIYGYFYTSYLRNKYGDLFLSKLSDKSAYNSWNPLNFYNSVDELTGKSFESFYQDTMKDLIKEWNKRAEALTPTPYNVLSKNHKFGWTNYEYPQKTSEGKVIALKSGLSYIDHFVLLDGKKEKTILYPGILQNEYPFKVRKDKLVFFEWEYDARYGYRDYSRLKVYDLKNDKWLLDKRHMKGRLAVPDHDGRRIAYIEWDEQQEQFLVILNHKGKTILKIPHPSSEVIKGLDWLNEDELVYSYVNQDDLKGIKQVNLETREIKVLKEETYTNIGNITVSDGFILFESPESGIDNIWLLTNSGERQITSALFGAYAPSVYEGKLLYSDYTVKGMNVVEKTLPWEEEQKSRDSFFPVFEKFARNENRADFEKETLSEAYTSKDYSQTGHAFNLHSWVILAPPLSSTITLIGLSRDVLNNFTFTAGGVYDLNQQTLMGFTGMAFTRYRAILDLEAAYGGRREDIRVGGEEIENKWEEGTFEAGLSVPWRSIHGRFLQNFTVRAFSKLIKVTNKISSDRTEVRDGALFSPGAEFSYSLLSRFSRRDMNPAWGFSLSGRAEEGHDISGSDQKGSFRGVDSRIYLPGLMHHHSFYHQFAYERQKDDFYQYSSDIFYPRGTKYVFLQEARKYSANYLLPVFYPDWNLSRYFYLKRVSLNLFYDELNGRYLSESYKAASTGWETIFEMNFLRLFVPLSVGVRGSYIISGIEKSSNYEIFLASVLGVF